MRNYLVILVTIGLARAALGVTLPPGFSAFNITGGNTITRGTTMAFSPDGKLFVLEQDGTIEVFSGSGAANWTRQQANFFANTPLSVDSSTERGLLGIAFDPNYAINRFVYVYYTTTGTPRRNRIVRYTANGAGDLALAGSAATLMSLDPLVAGNHNGGAMRFGPDGMLYVAVGDNANANNAQSLDNRLGKILRLNPDPLNPVPPDNPRRIDGIAGKTMGRNRAIWAAGLRNPYTFAFRPGGGMMYIADVGQSMWEEINVGRRGGNYGWGDTEGPFNVNAFPDYRRPIVYYHHDDASQSKPANGPGFIGQSIIGGEFYSPATETFPPAYRDDYFFADFVDGWIRRYDTVSRSVHGFAQEVDGPVALVVGDDGALYCLARNAAGFGAGRVIRIRRDP